MNLFIGNIADGVTDADLRAAFGAFGQVTSARVIVDRVTGDSRGFGFVEMPSETEATAAMHALDGRSFQGSVLVVRQARPKGTPATTVRRFAPNRAKSGWVSDEHTPTVAEKKLAVASAYASSLHSELARWRGWLAFSRVVAWGSLFGAIVAWSVFLDAETPREAAVSPVLAVVLTGASAASFVGGLILGKCSQPLAARTEQAGRKVDQLRQTVRSEELARITERKRAAAQRERERLLHAIGAESFEVLSAEEFERAITALLQAKGYHCEYRGGTGDLGVDILALRERKKFVVQCKHWPGRTVGSSTVRELMGSVMHERADGGMLITSGRFTAQARQWAQGKSLTLVDHDDLIRWTQQLSD